MADLLSLAQSFYDGAHGDAVERAALVTDRDSLRTAIRRGTTTGAISQASKNGVAYSMIVEFKPGDRLWAMNAAIAGLAANTRPGSRTRACF